MPRPRRPGRAQAVPPVRCTRTLLLLIACTTAVTLTAFLTTLGSSMGGGDGSGGGGGPVRTVAAFRRAGIATARARRSLLYATGKGLGAADSGTSGRTVNAASAKARGKDGGGETTQPGRSEPGGSEAQSQQQQTGRSGLPTIPALLSEARDAADLLFGRVLPGSAAALSGTGAGAPAAARSSVPPELQVPEARELLDLLRRVWGAHTSPDGDVSPAQVSAAAGSGSSAKRQRAQWIRADGDNRESAPQQHGPAKGSEHCSTAAGGALLLRAAQAARGLQRLACGATDTAAHGVGVGGGDVSGGSAAAPAPPALALPFVALRRATLAAVQLVYETQAAMPGGAAARACLAAIDQAAPQLLRPFAGALNCSRAARPALELLHISKCGGTSMCKLAAAAGLSNPAANLDFNCMVTAFNDGPKWTLKDPLVEMEGFWPAVDCPAWASEPRMGCRARASELVATGTNFYSNELTLHEVSSDSFLDASAPGAQAAGGAAAAVGACPELETLLLLRDPVERARSHVVEVAKVYGGYPNLDKAFAAHRDLRHWQSWAPAVLDNFMTRYLLGRQYLCRAFGTLTERDLQSASLTLASLDHVLLLEEGELNDVALGAGLGWSQSLGQQRSLTHDLERDFGFAPGSMQQLREWNALDQHLYALGRMLLRLDTAFHAAAALLAGRASRGAPAAAASNQQQQQQQQTPDGPAADQPAVGVAGQRPDGGSEALAGSAAGKRGAQRLDRAADFHEGLALVDMRQEGSKGDAATGSARKPDSKRRRLEGEKDASEAASGPMSSFQSGYLNVAVGAEGEEGRGGALQRLPVPMHLLAPGLVRALRQAAGRDGTERSRVEVELGQGGSNSGGSSGGADGVSVAGIGGNEGEGSEPHVFFELPLYRGMRKPGAAAQV